ncbi:unnamed protein product [Orchesella dallaii]|uniref:S-phase kinase-associated protein 1 n=1 Tax=Orchesella dallaii TaxID=48710 RepID=A0ABP1RWK8_9HEXA
MMGDSFKVKLQSNEGEIFKVGVDFARCCEVIKTLLEVVPLEERDEVIPLPSVDSKILKMVIDWATYHRNDEAPPPNIGDFDDLWAEPCAWDADFLKVDNETLLKLICAANYLDIRGLLILTCKTYTIMVMGKTAEQVRQLFITENGTTPSELKTIPFIVFRASSL